MELRAVDGARVADKTVLKMMREMGLRCGIRRETDYPNATPQGEVGETFGNAIARDFAADGPWQKMGADVTEFKRSFGKAHLAPVYDFGSKEIVAHSISEHPDLAQRRRCSACSWPPSPKARGGAHSDMGWRYQHAAYVGTLAENGFVQSMSRKGNCIDNGATEQVFGHIKDEFFAGATGATSSRSSATSKVHRPLEHKEAPGELKGLTPVEFGTGPFRRPRRSYDLSRPSSGTPVQTLGPSLLNGAVNEFSSSTVIHRSSGPSSATRALPSSPKKADGRTMPVSRR